MAAANQHDGEKQGRRASTDSTAATPEVRARSVHHGAIGKSCQLVPSNDSSMLVFDDGPLYFRKWIACAGWAVIKKS